MQIATQPQAPSIGELLLHCSGMSLFGWLIATQGLWFNVNTLMNQPRYSKNLIEYLEDRRLIETVVILNDSGPAFYFRTSEIFRKWLFGN